MLKRALRSVLLSGPLRVVQRARAPRIVVLQYHSIQPDADELRWLLGSIIHSAAEFDRQMEYVAKTCSPVALDDVPSMISRRTEIPRRAVAVTFDDGYRDNLSIAAPILERHGLRGAFYVTTSALDGTVPWFCRLRSASVRDEWSRETFLERGRLLVGSTREERERLVASWFGSGSVPADLMMTWADARALRQRGHTVGSHTVSHPNLARVSPTEARRELSESAEDLRSHLGEAPLHFAYPNPGLRPLWNDATRHLCEEAGYVTAVTSDPGPVTTSSSALSLSRVSAPGTWKTFRWKLEKSLAGLGS